MKLVVQRVKEASLAVEGKEISRIGVGYAVYTGIEKGEDEQNLDFFAKKLANLRIMEDENGKMNRSILDCRGEILLISQFTLMADVSHGNRPSFFEAEEPARANKLYLLFAKKLEELGLSVKLGVFGADMQISQLNDGPVTIIL